MKRRIWGVRTGGLRNNNNESESKIKLVDIEAGTGSRKYRKQLTRDEIEIFGNERLQNKNGVKKRTEVKLPEMKVKQKKYSGKKRKIIKSFEVLYKREIYDYRTKIKKIYGPLLPSEKAPHFMNIKITPNNIFCSFRREKKTMLVLSSGILKVKSTKKKLKFTSELIIKKFLMETKKFINDGNLLIIVLTAPLNVRKEVLELIYDKVEEKELEIIVKIDERTSFNGCRAKKKKRLKIKGVRVTK
jgi:ribosomal protein S11